tara:strand:- start:41 stop:559 length:519 start_codon:yes stop_codon:yes gene_type:complete
MYYTYAYLREDNTPYYIGKGKGHRINSKTHSVSLPPKERRVFLKQNLTEEEAFKHEIYMISIIPNLRNICEGGQGSSGRECTMETREKISNANTGRKRTEKQKQNMRGERSLSKEEIQRRTDRLPSRKGVKLSEETKKKMSDSKQGRKMNLTDEQRKLRSEQMRKAQQKRWG